MQAISKPRLNIKRTIGTAHGFVETSKTAPRHLCFKCHQRTLARMSAPKSGVIVALWTPTKDEVALDKAGLLSNVEFLKAKGITGFMILGSTGEFARLDVQTRIECLSLLRPLADEWPTIVNASAIRPADVITVGKRARELGFGTMSLLPPAFYGLAQADLAEFFIYCAKAVGLPLFLYNFPERAGTRINIETIRTVADSVELAGVKQSGAEFEYHRDLVKLAREKNFVVFSGAEVTLPEALGLGVNGCVSGLANAVPELVVGIHQAALQGDREKTEMFRTRIDSLLHQVNVLEFPLNVAAAMLARGLATGKTKTPLSAQTSALLNQVVEKVRALYAEWGLERLTGKA
ncbi:MAG TPA: dihydrodipicolinate synthase family protein [Verrucomicrobiota bacterium]|nr:dihydrodipicolinate synthase family protein [Verrucomicrobiota bacterium]